MAGRNGSGGEKRRFAGMSRNGQSRLASEQDLKNPRLRTTEDTSPIRIPRFDSGRMTKAIRTELNKLKNWFPPNSDTHKRLAIVESALLQRLDKVSDPDLSADLSQSETNKEMRKRENELRAAIDMYNATPGVRRPIIFADDPLKFAVNPKWNKKTGTTRNAPLAPRKTWKDPSTSRRSDAAPVTAVAEPPTAPAPDDIALQAVLSGTEDMPVTQPAKTDKETTKAAPKLPATTGGAGRVPPPPPATGGGSGSSGKGPGGSRAPRPRATKNDLAEALSRNAPPTDIEPRRSTYVAPEPPPRNKGKGAAETDADLASRMQELADNPAAAVREGDARRKANAIAKEAHDRSADLAETSYDHTPRFGAAAPINWERLMTAPSVAELSEEAPAPEKPGKPAKKARAYKRKDGSIRFSAPDPVPKEKVEKTPAAKAGGAPQLGNFPRLARERARRIANGEVAAPAPAPEATTKKGEKRMHAAYTYEGVPSAAEIADTVRQRKFETISTETPPVAASVATPAVAPATASAPAVAAVARERTKVIVSPEKETLEYVALMEARDALAKASEVEAKEHTWNKRFLSLGGLLGRAKRELLAGDRNQAEARWKQALSGYAQMQLAEESAKAAAWATERWGADSPKTTKYVEAHKGNVMRRRVLGEMRELNAQRIELMSAREKGLMMKTLQWYGKQPAWVRYGGPALVSASLATGLTIATGGAGTLFAAGVYGASRLLRSALGVTVGTVAGTTATRAARWWLKIEEKAAGRSERSTKTRADIRNAMRNATPMSAEDAVALYSRTLEQNDREARRENLIQIIAGVSAGAIAGGGSSLAAEYALSGPPPVAASQTGGRAPALTSPVGGESGRQPVPSPTQNSFVPEPTSEMQPLTRVERDRLIEINRAPTTEAPPSPPAPTPSPAEQPAPAPSAPIVAAPPAAPSTTPSVEVPLPQQTITAPAPSTLFSERITAAPGQSVWAIAEQRLMSDPRFASLDRAQQDFFLDSQRRALADHVRTLSPAAQQELGFRTGNINDIRAGDAIDLSYFNDSAVQATLYEQAAELTRAQRENILRYRGWNTAQIGAALQNSQIPDAPLAEMPGYRRAPVAPQPSVATVPPPPSAVPPPVPEPQPRVVAIPESTRLTPPPAPAPAVETTPPAAPAQSGPNELLPRIPGEEPSIPRFVMERLEGPGGEFTRYMTPAGAAGQYADIFKSTLYGRLSIGPVALSDILSSTPERLAASQIPADAGQNARYFGVAFFTNLQENLGHAIDTGLARPSMTLEAYITEFESRNTPPPAPSVPTLEPVRPRDTTPPQEEPLAGTVETPAQPLPTPEQPPQPAEAAPTAPTEEPAQPEPQPVSALNDPLLPNPDNFPPPRVEDFGQEVADANARARQIDTMYSEDLRSMFDIKAGIFSSGEDGVLRFEALLGWKDAATFLRDATESPEVTSEALSLKRSEVETLRAFMERARDDYNVPVEGTLKAFMRAAAEAQADVLYAPN